MKKTLLASVALATASLTMVGLSAPAAAQSKLGIAVVDVEAAIGQSAAYKTAIQQMQTTTYKGALADLNAREAALQAEIKQKADALDAAIKAAGAKPTPAQQTALQTQYAQFQQRQQEAQNELQALQAPIQLARAYAVEQIQVKLDPAYKNVMAKNKVDLLLKAAAAADFQANVDLTGALVTELNTLVPSVGIVPPQGWQPGQTLNPPQAAAPAAAPGTAAPAAAQPNTPARPR